MNLHTKLIVSALCVGALPFASAADFDDFGRVVRVAPQMEQVNTPRQECRTEYVQAPPQQQRGAGGSILGGLAGALIGSQVGGGSGRVAATAAGAIAGAVVGDHAENDNQPVTPGGEQAVRQCRTVDHWESRPAGFEVTYEYRGHNYTNILPYDPGQRIKLRVSVVPQP